MDSERIDWKPIIAPYKGDVIFTGLTADEQRPAFTRNVACIRFPAGETIDIEWSSVKRVYLVRFYKDAYERLLRTEREKTPEDVVKCVASLCDEWLGPWRPTQTITWRPGGAQGAEMPADCLDPTTKYFAYFNEPIASNLHLCAIHFYKWDGEIHCMMTQGWTIKWSDVLWYVPCADLRPPKVNQPTE